MTVSTHTIIGLPGSGKTTFIAALWHLLTAGDIPTSLELDRLSGDSTYLDRIATAWRRCEVMQRTAIEEEASFEIHIRRKEDNLAAVVSLPDLSGETFREQVAFRVVDRDYVSRLENPGGILLFVNARRPTPPLSIADFQNAIADTTVLEDSSEVTLWSANMMAEQVELVELLQFLQHPPFQRSRRRLALIISAWDVVPAPRRVPWRWLAEELPLLHQFLVTNGLSFEVEVFGVSAQGGEISDNTRRILARMDSSSRIQCVTGTFESGDLTAPVRWLMDV